MQRDKVERNNKMKGNKATAYINIMYLGSITSKLVICMGLKMEEMVKKIYLSSPTMNGNEMKYIQEAFDTNWIAPLGKNVDEFEREVAKKVGVSYAAALSSGTAAIHLALKGVGIKKGDLVFCSDLTFSASCNPILYENAIPVFIDSEEESWNMSPKALKKAFESYKKPAAVIVVHLYGTPAKLDEIKEICDREQVPLIEDAAESLGAFYHGIATGALGSIGVYSFNGNKIITTSGGGMLVSNNQDLIDKVKFWATQSREKERFYEHKEIGYNYRMSNVVAGIGRGQLIKLEDFIKKKEWIYNYYKEAFQHMEEISMNPIPDNCNPNYWLSCLQLSEQSKIKPVEIIEAMEKENIESRPVWKPMHLQPVFQKFDYVKDREISVSEKVFLTSLCLPSDIKNKEEDMERIIKIICKVLY